MDEIDKVRKTVKALEKKLERINNNEIKFKGYQQLLNTVKRLQKELISEREILNHLESLEKDRSNNG